MSQLRENLSNGRFELEENGAVVFADVRMQPGLMIIDHVESPVALRGTGAAGRFMAALAAEARARSLKIRPICSYAAAWLQRSAENADLIG
jgi:uncharacterized protein